MNDPTGQGSPAHESPAQGVPGDENPAQLRQRIRELETRVEEQRQVVQEQSQALEVLLSISEGTSTVVGRQFFPMLAQRLAETLGVSYAFVAEHVPATNGEGPKARTLGFWAEGKLIPNFTYALEGTPCNDCLKGGVIVYPRDVQRLFPDDQDLVDLEAESYCGVGIQDVEGRFVGNICVLDRSPINENFGDNPVIQLFAARAGAELDRLRMERDLRALESNMAYAGRLSTLGQMAATIAHEINQPLSAISSYASAARRLYGDLENVPPEPMQLMDKSWREAQRAGEIIRRLRRFVEDRGVDFSTFEMNTLITEVLELALPDLTVNGVECQVELGEDLPVLLGDSVQIQQVVLNLIRNAQESICSLPEGGRTVRVLTERVGDRGVRVRVADNGPGFDIAEFDQLTEPFVTRREEGMGLGLAIAKSILRRHDGKFWPHRLANGGVELCFELSSGRPRQDAR